MATFFKSHSVPEAVAASLGVARPVDTMVLNAGILYRSTDASAASYTGVDTVGSTFINSPDVLNFESGDVVYAPDGTGIVGVTGTGELRFDDDVLVISDPADPTKRARFDSGAISAATLRVIALPDSDVNLRGVVRPIADVGNGGVIPVTTSLAMPITTAAAGPDETSTLPDPSFMGQDATFHMDVDGGDDRVITAASPITIGGATTMRFGQADDFIVLKAGQVAGALVWRIVVNIGVVVV